MKTYIPLDRLKRSRDSGSALYNMHPTDVLGRAGGGGVNECGGVNVGSRPHWGVSSILLFLAQIDIDLGGLISG